MDVGGAMQIKGVNIVIACRSYDMLSAEQAGDLLDLVPGIRQCAPIGLIA
jgi:hypothetical protein